MNWFTRIQNETNCFFSQLLSQCQKPKEVQLKLDFTKETSSFETDFLAEQQKVSIEQKQMWAWDNHALFDFDQYQDLLQPSQQELVRIKSLRLEQESKITNFFTKEISTSTSIQLQNPELEHKKSAKISPSKKKKIDKIKIPMRKQKS